MREVQNRKYIRDRSLQLHFRSLKRFCLFMQTFSEFCKDILSVHEVSTLPHPHGGEGAESSSWRKSSFKLLY